MNYDDFFNICSLGVLIIAMVTMIILAIATFLKLKLVC